MLDTRAAFDLVDLLEKRSAQGRAAVICEHRQEYLRGIFPLCTRCNWEVFPASRRMMIARNGRW